jgi:predicted Zn-dependent peptidase
MSHRLTALLLIILGAFMLASCNSAADNPNIYLVHDPKATKVRAYLIIPREVGPFAVAHYTEHLAWIPNFGIESRPLGRDTNAWTSEFVLGYWLSGKPEELPDMLTKLATVFQPINLKPDFAAQEAKILLREHEMRNTAYPDFKVSEEMQQFLYAGDFREQNDIEFLDDVLALNYDDAKAFHAKTHLPAKAKLFVTGDIWKNDLAQALKQANFPELSADNAFTQPPASKLQAPAEQIFNDARPDISPRMIWRKIVKLPEPRDYNQLDAEARFLSDIHDSNLPGGLAKALRFDAFVTESFSVSVGAIDERHIEFEIIAHPDKNVTFAQMQTALETALEDSGKGIPQPTFDRVKNRILDGLKKMREGGQAEAAYANYSLGAISELREPLEEKALDKLAQDIALNDINRLAALLVGPGRKAVAFIGKDHQPKG